MHRDISARFNYRRRPSVSQIDCNVFQSIAIEIEEGALVLTTLTAMFFVVIIVALARGLNIECGCFGTVGGKHIGLVNLAIDTSLFLLSLLLFLALRTHLRPRPAGEICAEESSVGQRQV